MTLCPDQVEQGAAHVPRHEAVGGKGGVVDCDQGEDMLMIEDPPYRHLVLEIRLYLLVLHVRLAGDALAHNLHGAGDLLGAMDGEGLLDNTEASEINLFAEDVVAHLLALGVRLDDSRGDGTEV